MPTNNIPYHPLTLLTSAKIREFVAERTKYLKGLIAALGSDDPKATPSSCLEELISTVHAIDDGELSKLLYGGKFGEIRRAISLIHLDVTLEMQFTRENIRELLETHSIHPQDNPVHAKYMIWKRLYALSGVPMTTRLVAIVFDAMRRNGLTDPLQVTQELFDERASRSKVTTREFAVVLKAINDASV